MKLSFLKLLILTLLITILPFIIGFKLDGLYNIKSDVFESFTRILLLTIISVFFLFHFKLGLLRPLEKINFSLITYCFIAIISLMIFNLFLFLPINKLDLIKIFHNPPNFDYLFLVGITIMPVLEELFYRKITINFLIKKYSNTKTILLSSLLFTIAHILATHVSLLTVFLSGILFAWIYLKTKNILLLIGLHIINNILAYPILFLFGFIYENYFLTTTMFYVSYITILLLSVLLVHFSLLKLNKQ